MPPSPSPREMERGPPHFSPLFVLVDRQTGSHIHVWRYLQRFTGRCSGKTKSALGFKRNKITAFNLGYFKVLHSVQLFLPRRKKVSRTC